MEYRQLGGSGLKVPVLSMGTGTFGGAKGSGFVDVSMTPTDQSVEGTVTTGALDPSVALGTLSFTFHPGS